VEEKSLTPHIFPIWGSGKPNLLSSWGFRQGLPCCQNIRGYPPRGLPPKFETVSKKFGGWVTEHGVLSGLPLSEWRTNFFEYLGRKNPDPFFHFFEFRPRG